MQLKFRSKKSAAGTFVFFDFALMYVRTVATFTQMFGSDSPFFRRPEEAGALRGRYDALVHANIEIDEIRQQVLEAHKLLMALNPDNSKEFTDLIRALESGQ